MGTPEEKMKEIKKAKDRFYEKHTGEKIRKYYI